VIRGRCATCRAWDNSTTDDNDNSPCRQALPVITIPGNPIGSWPFTSESDWCGFYIADPDKLDEDE
jgi:hypothetical protein